jgi:ferric-dicitrate binding protein FerR (iron transport regulator)
MSTDADASRVEAAARHREVFDRDPHAPDPTLERQAHFEVWLLARPSNCAALRPVHQNWQALGKVLAAGKPKPNPF